MEMRSWTNRVKNEEVLQNTTEEINILYTTKRRKAKWIVHILQGNRLLKHVIEKKYNRKYVMDGKVRKKTYAATG